MIRTLPLVSFIAFTTLLIGCSKDSDISQLPEIAFANLERFNGAPPGDLLKDEKISAQIRFLVPQSDFKCLKEAMEWMPDLDFNSDGSLGVQQSGSRADQFRETYLLITEKGSFDLVLLCQLETSDSSKGKYKYFTNNHDLSNPPKHVQEWIYGLGSTGDEVSVSDGKRVIDVKFDNFVSALTVGAATPREHLSTVVPTHNSGSSKDDSSNDSKATFTEKSGLLVSFKYSGFVKDMLKTRVRHPDTLKVSNITVRYEKGSARILAATFSATNSYGVRDTKTATLAFRIIDGNARYPVEGGVIIGNEPTGNSEEDKYFSSYHTDIGFLIRKLEQDWTETSMKK